MDTQTPTQEDYQHIRDKILEYLSRQGFSEKKLIEKVTRLKKSYPHTKRYRFYTHEHVTRVTGELKEEGVINDHVYAQDVLRQLLNKKNGILRIKQKMYRRLIPPEIIDEVLHEFELTGRQQTYDKIVRDVKNKLLRLKEKGVPARQHLPRVYAFLAQKGYLPDDIKHILKQSGMGS